MSEMSSKNTENDKAAVTDSAEASREAIKAVEAMKAAMTQPDTEESVFITAGQEWRKTMKLLEREVEKELGRANDMINDVLAKERAKCRETLQKEFAEKEKQIRKEYEDEAEVLKKDHEAELEKMKKLYHEQLDEVQDAFRDKMAALRKEIDQHKEQIEVLMLHIDDPFVLQEIQMKQTQEEK